MTGIIAKYIRILSAILFLFIVPFISYSQVDHSDQPVKKDPTSFSHESSSINKSTDTKHQHLLDSIPADTKLPRELGVREKLGEHIAFKNPFIDSDGKAVQLNHLITKPVLILPVFFFCSRSCNIMLSNLAHALPEVPYKLGKDYQVIAFSFNAEEGPEIAKKAKSDYMSRLESQSGQPGDRFSSDMPPADAWAFLVGNNTSIYELTESLGFKFRKTGTHSFVHPNVLIVCDQNGKIIRYLYGERFLPFDIGMAISEAQSGTPSISVRKVINYCFSYDPKQKRYIFHTFRVAAIVVLVFLGFFYVFFLRRKNHS